MCWCLDQNCYNLILEQQSRSFKGDKPQNVSDFWRFRYTQRIQIKRKIVTGQANILNFDGSNLRMYMYR